MELVREPRIETLDLLGGRTARPARTPRAVLLRVAFR